MQTAVHITSGDQKQQKTALTIADNLHKDETVDMEDIAVVVQADGIDAVTSGGSGDDQVKSLLNEGVSVKACSNTLDMKNLEETDLIDGVEAVPSGAGELTRLESQGYAYLRP